ncbi:MAG: hypothetical protein ACOX6T_22490 [Myxococcales bacterium]
MRYRDWVLQQIEARRPSAEPVVETAVQNLVDALAAFRRGNRQVFGLDVARIEEDFRPALETAVVNALSEWRQHFEDESDNVSLLELGKVARLYGVEALKLAKRFPLRCDPLGSREGLSRAWLARLERLDEAMAGEGRLDLEAIHWVGLALWDEEEKGGPPEVASAVFDESHLYELALRYESGHGRPFPREIAAFVATADGIFIDDDPFILPVSAWSWEDRGLCIGRGGSPQGSLVVEGTGKKLLQSKVVDLDDDGVCRARYKSFAALVDAMLGD